MAADQEGNTWAMQQTEDFTRYCIVLGHGKAHQRCRAPLKLSASRARLDAITARSDPPPAAQDARD